MAGLKLTSKSLGIAVVCFTALFAMLALSSRFIILAGFERLEERLARQNLERVLADLDNSTNSLVQILGDWSVWDDTLEYITGKKPDYITENLDAETFANLSLQMLLLADLENRIVWGKIYDTETETLQELSPEMVAHLSGLSELWSHESLDSRRAGLICSPEGLILAVSGPIVDNNSSGPIAGTMIMTRAFGASEIEALSKRMQLQLAFHQHVPQQSMVPSSLTHLQYLTYNSISVIEKSNNILRMTSAIHDIQGRPDLTVEMNFPRDIYRQGHRTIYYFLIWLAIGGLIVSSVTLIVLRRTVLAPISSLHEQVADIADNSSFTKRLTSTSEDEIGELSMGINSMLDALTKSNSELMDAYGQLKDTQSQLVQSAKLASIGELAAGVAHELNQPLMVIRGTGQMITRGLATGRLSLETLSEPLDMIVRNTKRMMNIIEHLRNFSRQSNREPTRVNINKTIQDCFLLIGEQLRLREIEVEMNLAETLPRVWTDQNQLEQVLLNLITNARDAIAMRITQDKKSGPGMLSFSTHLIAGEQEAVEIWVKDNGCGIDPDSMEKIYDPFFTTKAVGEGTGLGLSISYGILKEHNGKLLVQETGPAGTTFVIRLPVKTV